MGTIYDDVDQDARDDHQHDPPPEWDDYELSALPAVGSFTDRDVLNVIESRQDREMFE